MPTRTLIYSKKILTLSSLGVLENSSLILEDNRILDIVTTSEVSADSFDHVIDLRRSYIVPGLIDAHAHLSSATARMVTEELVAGGTIDGVICAGYLVQSGITTIRDLGCKHAGIYVLKKAIEKGVFPGPRVFTAGRNMSGTGVVEGWRNFSYDGPDAFRKAVRREWQDGAQWIKLIISDGQWEERDVPLMALDEIHAAVSEAHSKGLRVSCHVDGERGVELAIKGNVDSIEHGVELNERSIEEMVKKNIFYIPTIYSYVNEVLPVWKTNSEPKLRSHRNSFELAYDSGVNITLGTDSNYLIEWPSQALVNEMKMLEAWGMKKSDVFAAATITAAKLLGLDKEIGSIEKGKVADFVVLGSDPLSSYDAFADIELVIQDGKVVSTLSSRCFPLKGSTLSASNSGTYITLLEQRNPYNAQNPCCES